MKTPRLLISLFLLIASCYVTFSCAQTMPKIALSSERVLHHGHVGVQGTGFTPKHNVSSHLRRPNGTEFPVLPILTDDRGQFTHDIDTLVLGAGVFELWVVDDGTNVSSNMVRFEVTLERPAQ